MCRARFAIGIALAVFGGLAVAPAVAAERALTIRLIQTRVSQQTLDVGPRGRSLGDVSVATHELRRAAANADTPTGSRIGNSSVAATVLDRRASSVVSTASLSRGTITSGGVTRRVLGALAVLGGTGDYANARGTVRVKRLSPTRSLVTFTLFLAAVGDQGSPGAAGADGPAAPRALPVLQVPRGWTVRRAPPGLLDRRALRAPRARLVPPGRLALRAPRDRPESPGSCV